MSQYKPAARVWVILVIAAAALVAAVTLRPGAATRADWRALAVLALGAAIAHVFPIRSTHNASYRMTNVFIIAGAILLPPALLTLLALAAVTPDAWRQRRRTGAVGRWLFNAANAALAAQAAGFLVRGAGGRELNSPFDLAVLLAAAVLFSLVQAVVVGMAISLQFQTPLRLADPFTPSALLGEFLLGLLGITVAGLWVAKPLLLFVVPVAVVIAHRLTRTAHLAHLAEVDAKTGLHNARYFDKALAEELARSRRLRRPLALLFADMDLLREVNNRYGHLAGDTVLEGVGAVLKATARHGDVVARFGGEEFAAVLPATDAEEALYLAERVRAAVEGRSFVLDDGTALRCTISIGVALFPDDAQDMAGLIKQADTAMYGAKRTRNAVAHRSLAPAARQPSPSGRARPVAAE